MTSLDERKQIILKAIVIEYVSSAEPIASEVLAQKYEFGVRGATIRNEMAELADLGFLDQPHTSAGRIPSDLGYRYYVDKLILNQPLGDEALRKVQSASPGGDVLTEMLRSTARALSRLTHLLTVATTLKNQKVSVKTAVLSALGPNQALFVLVLSNGHVENKMLECPAGLTLTDVGFVNEQLQKLVVGNALKSISRSRSPSSNVNSAVDKLLGLVWTSLRSMARETIKGTVISEGAEFMFAQPEFLRDFEMLSQLMDHLSQTDALYESVAVEPIRTVTIGHEHRLEKMQKLSIIRQSFFVGEDEAGVIALIGPTRMNYETGIPLVNFTAQALTDSLTKFFG